MRLIIKEYLTCLKEKDELDLILCDLLLQMGYSTHNVPKIGNRQFGVDVRASNKKELLLLVIKQGNINRNNWDKDPTSVRQSLNEIRDCYKQFISGTDSRKKLRIIVATNGVIDEAVRPNWEGFVTSYSIDGKYVAIEFWDIDTITKYIQDNLFDEHLFEDEMRSLLRKALYYVEESDYRNTYYEQIIDIYINKLSDEKKERNKRKILSSLSLSSQMISCYAANIGKYKIGIMATEYLIIRYWKYLFENNYYEKEKYISWLFVFCSHYEKWNNEYYNEIKLCCEIKNGLFMSNSIEQRVMIYEILGFLTSYACYLVLENHSKQSSNRLQEVVESIVGLFNNYNQIYYPPYDDNIRELSMVYRLFVHLGRIDEIKKILIHQCFTTRHMYTKYNKYPSPVDSFEDAVNIDMSLPAEEYVTSAFWGIMLEWIVLLDLKELYEGLKPFLEEDLKNVTKCAWYIKSSEEVKLYDSYAMYKAGVGVSFDSEKTFDCLKENIELVMKEYYSEQFSFDKYSFPALEFIICRYYGTLPRVKINE